MRSSTPPPPTLSPHWSHTLWNHHSPFQSQFQDIWSCLKSEFYGWERDEQEDRLLPEGAQRSRSEESKPTSHLQCFLHLTVDITKHYFGLFPFEFHTIKAMLRQKWFWSEVHYLQSFSLSPTFNLVFSFCNGDSGWQKDPQRNPKLCLTLTLKKFGMFLPPWPKKKFWLAFTPNTRYTSRGEGTHWADPTRP